MGNVVIYRTHERRKYMPYNNNPYDPQRPPTSPFRHDLGEDMKGLNSRQIGDMARHKLREGKPPGEKFDYPFASNDEGLVYIKIGLALKQRDLCNDNNLHALNSISSLVLLPTKEGSGLRGWHMHKGGDYHEHEKDTLFCHPLLMPPRQSISLEELQRSNTDIIHTIACEICPLMENIQVGEREGMLKGYMDTVFLDRDRDREGISTSTGLRSLMLVADAIEILADNKNNLLTQEAFDACCKGDKKIWVPRIIIALNEAKLLTQDNLNVASNKADVFAVILDQLALSKLLTEGNVALALKHQAPESLGVALTLLQRGGMLTQEIASMCLTAQDPFQLAKTYALCFRPLHEAGFFSRAPKPPSNIIKFIEQVYEKNLSFFVRKTLKFDDCKTSDDAVKMLQDKLKSTDSIKDSTQHTAITNTLASLGQSKNIDQTHFYNNDGSAPPAQHS